MELQDAKLHDDISPEIDWDEYEVEHDFGTAPTSPASVHSSYSAAATPMTPHWRSTLLSTGFPSSFPDQLLMKDACCYFTGRVEDRSPQRVRHQTTLFQPLIKIENTNYSFLLLGG